MEHRIKISHEAIAAYLEGELDPAVIRIRKEDPAYGLLFDIIDKVNEVVDDWDMVTEADVPHSFSLTEELLQAVYSGNMTKNQARSLAAGLLHSSDFLQRLVVKCGQLAPSLSGQAISEMENIAIKTDDEIISEISNVPNIEQINVYGKIYTLPVVLLEKFKNAITVQLRRTPKWAFAVVSALILIFVVYFGIRFYNTSYQIITAQNLLQDNYRIYMADTPRLSGNYKVTGIGQLMAEGEEERLNYLNEAYQKASRAIDHGSQSPDAKHLLGKVFIINHAYNQADSIFRLLSADSQNNAAILNDLGVLKFHQRDWQTAANYFKSALNNDNGFKEAYYNLAMAQMHMEKSDNALQSLNLYLDIETNEGWRKAALNLIAKIKNTQKL